MRFLALAIAALLALGPALAVAQGPALAVPFGVEDDAGTGGDAPDACVPIQLGGPSATLPPDAWGMLIPILGIDDHDVYRFQPQGSDVRVHLETAPLYQGILGPLRGASPLPTYGVTLLDPDCVPISEGAETAPGVVDATAPIPSGMPYVVVDIHAGPGPFPTATVAQLLAQVGNAQAELHANHAHTASSTANPPPLAPSRAPASGPDPCYPICDMLLPNGYHVGAN
jgi:hypothetical protein